MNFSEIAKNVNPAEAMMQRAPWEKKSRKGFSRTAQNDIRLFEKIMNQTANQ
jgi:hypothetical protein